VTDRISYLTVALEQDTRIDDAQQLIDAILLLRGVCDVDIGKTVGPDAFVERSRIRLELGDEIKTIMGLRPSRGKS
jgi:hypothetical protein